ncbi:phosphatase PAP2 family protein [Actinomadura atramentaria]|uniref:phosphatase PAP2 family protein n=1 Tax=Actinomadura atramentaria TaxID=1990 RepID=UPI00036875BA|nr:phosphatase PAP2 family protein [Actinomadura atramentaria]
MRAPEFSADWYRAVTEFAHGTPGWVQKAADVGTNAGLLLFAVLFVAGWWRARRDEERAMALALLAPCAVFGAYLVSEVSKSYLREPRPCRTVPGALHIAACPPPSDWSFPSNHATIAAASAAAIVVAWRAMAPLVLPLAALMAFSRVFVGVHYPHDVAAGFLVGCAVATLLALLLVKVVAPLVVRVRAWPVGAVLLGAAPGAAASLAAPAGTPAAAGRAPVGTPVGTPVGGVSPLDDPAPTLPDVLGADVLRAPGRHRRPE